MFRKSLKTLLLTLIIIPAIIIFNACSIGVCTLQFETWGGTGPSDIVMSPGESLDSTKFYDAEKVGYIFECWCYDIDLKKPISFPMVASNGVYTYYAKYELDENYFVSADNYISWSNIQEDITYESTLNPYTQLNIMLDKTNMNFVIDSIVIESGVTTPGQEFSVNGFEVYDEQGKVVEDSDTENINTFVPTTQKDANETYKYVLRITAGVRGGNFKIKINGKVPA